MVCVRFSILLICFTIIGCEFITENTLGLQSEETKVVNYNEIVKIIDGDTYDILIDGIQTRIRMDGIDAPERGMDFYKKSKDYLGKLGLGESIRLEGDKKDRYGRLIAKSYLPDGRELGEEMVKAGMAWHFKKYSSDKTLNDLEISAREQRIGLWSLNDPIAPWEYRKMKKKKK